MTHVAENEQVKRRRVFYIPGYDPFPPRRYRELYRKEGAAQAEISGYQLTLTPKEPGRGFGWYVAAQMDGAETQTDIEVLIWSDIVQGSMGRGILATYWQLLRTSWTYIGSGAIFRLARLRKGPTIAAFYPIALLLLQLSLAIAAGFLTTYVIFNLSEAGLAAFYGPRLFQPWFKLRVLGAIVLGLLAAVMALRWFKAQDHRLFAHYLMHDYAYSAQAKGATPPDLQTRMDAFGDTVAAALTEEWDEVLVVGHSSGAHLAVSILADLIRRGRVPLDGPALGFLSLGHVVPMVSFLPDATQLRGDLAYLSARGELTWIDVTAPGDGCSFALCDPVSVTGVAPRDKRWPLVISAAFTQTLSPDRWQALRWRFFRLHFQYLCAFDQPRDYDYFRITAGPLTLAQRFRGRPASKSRIERPLSRYRHVA